MTFKDFLVVLWFVLATSLAINYFWGPQPKQLATHEQALNTRVDFIDTKPAAFKAEQTEVMTDSMQLVFSSQGATLERLAFKHPIAKGYEFIDTIFPPTANDWDHRSFLVAFDDTTPFYYSLVDRQETADTISLAYTASFDKGTITKTFIVYKHQYQLDLVIDIACPAEVKVQPRIFFAAPVLSSHKDEGLSGLVEGDNPAKLRVVKGPELLNSYWNHPTIFGAQNIYFLHALVTDKEDSIKRGYFKLDNNLLMVVLECSAQRGTTQQRLSFYCGPKEEKAVSQIDPRLTQTIDYGWFAPVGHLLLRVLSFLYAYIHNYGWAIVILTLLIRLLLLPFSLRTERSLKRGVDMSRKLQALERKYKDNPEVHERERLALLKREGFGMGGCLGLFVQFPILIALSYVLRNAIQLYKAPFIGWIKDLSIPDPYYVLPMLTGIAMLGGNTARDLQQRVAMLIGALLFTAFSATFPAGLTLYLFVSTASSTLQSFLQRRLSPQ